MYTYVCLYVYVSIFMCSKVHPTASHTPGAAPCSACTGSHSMCAPDTTAGEATARARAQRQPGWDGQPFGNFRSGCHCAEWSSGWKPSGLWLFRGGAGRGGAGRGGAGRGGAGRGGSGRQFVRLPLRVLRGILGLGLVQLRLALVGHMCCAAQRSAGVQFAQGAVLAACRATLCAAWHVACNMRHREHGMARGLLLTIHSMQHATCNMQHATYSMQHATCSKQHATCNIQQTACNMQHATCSKQHAPCTTTQQTGRYAPRCDG
jgi:hypothetical protein